jgi:hypothetical protein
VFVGRPISVEILTAINTSLKYSPTSTIFFLVAVNLNKRFRDFRDYYCVPYFSTYMYVRFITVIYLKSYVP